MILQDSETVEIKQFNGLFDQGEDDIVPPDHFIDCLNNKFIPGVVLTRSGTSVRHAYTGNARTCFFTFNTPGVAPILFSIDSAGNFYKDDTLLSTIVGASYFSAFEFFNKLFISFNNGSQGVGNLYIYDYTSNTFRTAGCDTPTAAGAMVAADGAAGNINAGVHLFAVVYETDTGFFSVPGPLVAGVFTPTSYTAPGSKQCNLSNIPTYGGARVIARHILATKANQTEYFYIPDELGGLINDNVTTTSTLNFFDTDLAESADTLFNLFPHPPCGVAISEYNARTVVAGFPSPDGSLARLSLAADPESFSKTDGFIIVSKDDGFILTNVTVIRDLLYLFKNGSTSVSNDDGEEPSNWDVNPVDGSIGAFVRGVMQASVTLPTGVTHDFTLVANTSGLYLFTGVFVYPELSWKISNRWSTLDSTKVSCAIDTVKKNIYISGLNNGILVGDYTQCEMIPQFDKIKWSPWTFPETVLFLGLAIPSAGASPEMVFSTTPTAQLIKMDSAQTVDYGANAIDSYEQLALFSPNPGGLNIFNAIQFKTMGAGELSIRMIGQDANGGDSTKDKVLQPVELITQPNRAYTRISMFMQEKMSLKFETSDANAWHKITWVKLFMRQMFEQRPT